LEMQKNTHPPRTAFHNCELYSVKVNANAGVRKTKKLWMLYDTRWNLMLSRPETAVRLECSHGRTLKTTRL
jgi:hypothetical protein